MLEASQLATLVPNNNRYCSEIFAKVDLSTSPPLPASTQGGRKPSVSFPSPRPFSFKPLPGKPISRLSSRSLSQASPPQSITSRVGLQEANFASQQKPEVSTQLRGASFATVPPHTHWNTGTHLAPSSTKKTQTTHPPKKKPTAHLIFANRILAHKQPSLARDGPSQRGARPRPRRQQQC